MRDRLIEILAAVVVIVVACATILRASGHLDNNSVAIVYAAAIGFAAGAFTPHSPRQP